MRKAEAVGLLDALAECAEASDLAEMRRVALRRVLALIPADAALWCELDLESSASRGDDEPTGSVGTEYWQGLLEHKGDSPLYHHRVTTLDLSVRKESDFLTHNRWRRTGIYRDVLQTAGFEEQMAFIFFDGPVVRGLALCDRWGRFGERERSMLELARLPLARVHATVSERARTARLLGALSAGVGPFVLTEPDGSISFATRAADMLIDRHGIRTVREGLLSTGAGVGLHAKLVAEEEGYATYLLEERATPHPDLTGRELQVLELARTGLKSAEIGDRLVISTRTVERHLRNAYAKLDVHSRTAAIAAAFPATV